MHENEAWPCIACMSLVAPVVLRAKTRAGLEKVKINNYQQLFIYSKLKLYCKYLNIFKPVALGTILPCVMAAMADRTELA